MRFAKVYFGMYKVWRVDCKYLLLPPRSGLQVSCFQSINLSECVIILALMFFEGRA